MQQYTPGALMGWLAIDVMGPLPLTETGNRYVLIVADYFTKWPEAFALPDQETGNVVEVLVKDVVCRFRVLPELHSDQGRNFESNIFAEMCGTLGITKTHTTPQSDGMVERMNRTLEAQLSMFVDHHQWDWDQHIPYLVIAYLSATHESTQSSPACLILRRELKLPIDLLCSRPEEYDVATLYVQAMQEIMEEVHKFTRNICSWQAIKFNATRILLCRR